MRFKALTTCHVGGHYLLKGDEVDLSDDTPDTPGVIEALNRPAPPEEDDEVDGGELAGDPASPPKAKRGRKPKQPTTE